MEALNKKMKNIFFGFLATLFITMSSFSKKEEIEGYHTCYYKMYNSSTGQHLGNWSLILPADVPCGSTKAKNLAIASYNLYH